MVCEFILSTGLGPARKKNKTLYIHRNSEISCSVPMIPLVPLFGIHTPHTSLYSMLLINLAVVIASTRVSMDAFKSRWKIMTFLNVITESQNYRIAEVGRRSNLWRSIKSKPLLKYVPCNGSHRYTSRWVLNISIGHSTTSMDNCYWQGQSQLASSVFIHATEFLGRSIRGSVKGVPSIFHLLWSHKQILAQYKWIC